MEVVTIGGSARSQVVAGTGVARKLAGQRGELAPAGHLADQLIERDLVSSRVQAHPAEAEDGEMVPDEERVMRVVGDEHDPDAGRAGHGRRT